jgi:hypothetical protein
VVTDPHEHLIVPVQPAATASMREKDPRISPWTTVHHDAVQPVSELSAALLMIRLPHGGLEPLTTGVAYGYVREEIVIVVGYQ